MSRASEASSRRGSVASDISDNSSICSTASFAPTVSGGETPFAEFAWSVQQLCKKFWPRAYEEVEITRLDGGSFNRIVALSVKSSLSLTRTPLMALPDSQSHEGRSEHYILRISREDDSEVADHIMTLYYVQTHTSLPVPRVLAFDTGPDNILEKPYTLQQRIPGVPLDSIIDKLTFDQRRNLAVQIAKIIRQIQGVESPVAGKIGIPNRVQHSSSEDASTNSHAPGPRELSLEQKLAFMTMAGLPLETSEAPKSFDEAETKTSGTDTLQVLHFDLQTTLIVPIPDPYNGVVNTVTSTTMPVLSYFNFQFVRHMLQVLQNDPTDVILTSMYHRLMQLALEMDEDRCLGKDVFNLFHGDLEPRNIMVHVCDFGDVHIAGILDWDNSGFVPRAVSCVAPRWVWSVKEGVDSQEREDEEDPTDPEQVALKEAFDNAVGDDFVEMAYSLQHRLVRRLFPLSIVGIYSNKSFDEFDNITKAWAELRPTLKDNNSDDDSSASNDSEDDSS